MCAPGSNCSTVLLSQFPNGSCCVSLKEDIFLGVHNCVKGVSRDDAFFHSHNVNEAFLSTGFDQGSEYSF